MFWKADPRNQVSLLKSRRRRGCKKQENALPRSEPVFQGEDTMAGGLQQVKEQEREGRK